ncbi:cytoplasm protein [Pseudozyma hubeiensis SY62]|uniref:Cytoplasm protein n=1 Tax=Pseudozyma hubeiensis (strain SY62) TaxID=1305764 RepID=R9P4L1_PSEHS|nr:cytoplasm protein [Pseudozyma hubeiensis SY62]GAC96244.1 cytoplasm protein [Pseudozyma hubeiensis SY62]
MLASSSTLSRVEASHHNASQLLLRGTRDGDLAATLLSSSSTSTAERTPLFTWSDLLRIVSSGNLQHLSRHPDSLREYFAWMDSIKSTYGSVTSFLLSERFTATKLLEKASPTTKSQVVGESRCFRSNFVPGVDCQILLNDWPYSIPHDAHHYVVWSCCPILHRDLVFEQDVDEETARLAWGIVSKRGLCGTLTPTAGLQIPTIKDHSTHLPDLLPSFPEKEERLQQTLQTACSNLVTFIEAHWDTSTYEVAFFANPPSLQSVPSLAHFHVLVKKI